MQKFDDADLIELACKAGISPMSAGDFVARHLQKIGMSARQAATKMGCANSTVSRLISGGDLSIEMAISLNKAFGFPIDGLFKLEANNKTYLALQKISADIS